MLRVFRLWGLFLRLLLFGYCLCNSYVVGDVTVTDDPYASERWNSATHSQGSGDFFQVLQEFSSHIIIRPEIRHASHKRLLSHTLDKENGLHLPLITLSYHHNGQRVSIDLKRHDGLLPDEHFLRYQNSHIPKGQVVQNFTKTELDLCHYQGCIRGNSDSIVAVSTCHGGVNGIVFDGIATYFIQSVRDGRLQDDHFLFRHSDSLSKNHTCGYDGNVDNHHNSRFHIPNNSQFNRILRHKRSYDDDSNVIRGPSNANRHSLYVELVIVVDNGVYKSFGENRKKVHQYCKDLVNIVNALYVPLNIFVTLQGVVIWNESNEISISSSSSHTLHNFLKYRHNKLSLEHPNDHAQLLTKQIFDSGVIGKATLGTFCSHNSSGGITRYGQFDSVATTMAHEMGHNFGMNHDSPDCRCPDEKCIMSDTITSVVPVHWSSCSIDQLNIAFSHGNNYCMRNKPTQLFESPQCGNGFVETGEQCDCGLPNYCENTCCDPFTCMLHTNATCATGECCDLNTCRPKIAGTACRDAEKECDLPEYCTGESEHCPADVFKRDTEMCDNGQAFCYQGNCRSHTTQCRILWGPTGFSLENYYAQNTNGTIKGNCGMNRITGTFIPCEPENVACGILHCHHLKEENVPDIGSKYNIFRYVFGDGDILPTISTAVVDFGLNSGDPGLTPNGARCGDQMMCVNQKCMALAELRSTGMGRECPQNCNGNGVCNSRGNCHCNVGFTGTTCLIPWGPGGSVDSGPATNPNINEALHRLMFIFIFAVLPIWTGFCLFTYCSRKQKTPNGCILAKNMPGPTQLSILSLNTTTNTQSTTSAIPKISENGLAKSISRSNANNGHVQIHSNRNCNTTTTTTKKETPHMSNNNIPTPNRTVPLPPPSVSTNSRTSTLPLTKNSYPNGFKSRKAPSVPKPLSQVAYTNGNAFLH